MAPPSWRVRLSAGQTTSCWRVGRRSPSSTRYSWVDCSCIDICTMQTIKTALPIIHLIDVIHPGLIDFSIVKQAEKITGPV